MLLNTDSMCLVLCAAPLQGSNFKTMPSSPTQILQFQLNINNLGANQKCTHKEIQESSNFWGMQSKVQKPRGEEEVKCYRWELRQLHKELKMILSVWDFLTTSIFKKKKKKSNKPSSPPPLLSSSLGRGRSISGWRGKQEHWFLPTPHLKTDWERNFLFHSLVWRGFDISTVCAAKQQHRRCHYLPPVHRELLLHI